jgi:D-alanine-D-alanine ligase
VVQQEADLAGIGLPYPLFVKPVAEGTGKGISPASRVDTDEALAGACRGLLARFRQPVLVETYLPGREFTVGILGTGPAAAVLAVMEIRLKGVAETAAYSYVNKEECEERVEYRLANDGEAGSAAALALEAWRALGCRDAGRVDLRSDAGGRPHFLEANPLAGLHPEHSDLPIMCALAGIGYDELIGRILDSAAGRIDARPQRAARAATRPPKARSAAE